MRLVYLEEERKREDFAVRAAKYFALHPDIYTYTDSDVKEGCFFAVRWGAGDDCVLVFKIDEYYEVINYRQLITDVGCPGTSVKGDENVK